MEASQNRGALGTPEFHCTESRTFSGCPEGLIVKGQYESSQMAGLATLSPLHAEPGPCRAIEVKGTFGGLGTLSVIGHD